MWPIGRVSTGQYRNTDRPRALRSLRASGEKAPLATEVGGPLQAARPCETQVGAERVAHGVDEPLGAARREVVLPPDVEYLHARMLPVDPRLDPPDETVPEGD